MNGSRAEALIELDGALDELLSVLDDDEPEGEPRLEAARAHIDASFAALREATADAQAGAAPEARARLETVLEKYALAASLLQRRRSELALELEELRGVRRRIGAAKGVAATGEECDVRG